MRVLITGIDGFVGSHAAELLLNTPGVEVHGTVLESGVHPNISHIHDSLHLHELNILDFSSISSLISDISPERIIHLAGQAFVPTSMQDPVQTFHVNIFGGINILESVRIQTQKGQNSPAVLIVSTGEVYGKATERDPQPLTEEFPIAPTNPYAASKASIDLIAQQFCSSFGLNVTVVRPFNHAGPRQSPVFVCSDFAKQFAEIAAGVRRPTLFAGNIDARRDFTDVRDVVWAYWLLFERKTKDIVYNVCSGRAVQIRELLSMLEGISGVKVEVISQSARFRSYDVSMVVGSYDRLRSATGWSPKVPLRQTLQDVFAYWSQVTTSEHREPPK